MITYIKGDLFDTECKIIVHGCNAQGKMGSGVAKLIREKYPKAYSHYMKSSLELGTNVWVDCGDKIIINAITQKYYGNDGKKYVSYDAVDSCMKDIAKNVPQSESISLPMLGAGRANGSWNIIEAIINENLKYHNIIVYQL